MFPKNSKSARILIVEDELIVSADIAARLTRIGYQVVAQADCPSVAQEICLKQRPDLVLMDIRLRDQDGIQAANAIREKFKIPIVFLTAHADEATLDRAKLAEPYGYVLKPFEERDLKIVIEMAIYKAQAELQLAESRHFLETILNSMGESVIATDDLGVIKFLNPAAQQLLGKSAKLVGKRMREVIQLRRIHTDGTDVVDWPSSCGDGGTEPVEVVAEIGGRPAGIMIASNAGLQSATAPGQVYILRDVSEQRRLEESLRQAQRMEALGQLAAGIAHDFSNILTVVCINAELLRESVGRNAGEKELLSDITLATDRATRMTEQLLAMGKNKPIQIKVLDLNDIVRDSMRMLRRLLPENIHCDCHIAADPILVNADQSQVQQAVMNLVINARNALPNGGRLGVATGVKESPLNSTLQGSHMGWLEVSDDGVGMDLETQSRIWEPFYSRKDSGNGLGLAVVYGAVKQLGGHVSVASELGKGSTFQIMLPLATGDRR